MAAQGYYDEFGNWHEPGQPDYPPDGRVAAPAAPWGYTIPTANEPTPTGDPAPTPGPPPPAPPPPVPGPRIDGGGGGTPTSTGADFGSLLQGWGQSFTPTPGLGQAVLPTLPDFVGPNLPTVTPFDKQFNAPAAPTVTPYARTASFTPTTAADVLADPSYTFRFNQGLGGVLNSAAGMGTLRSGATLKDLTNYGQSVASTEFGNIDARRMAAQAQEENQNLNAYTTNTSTEFGRYDRALAGAQADFGSALQGWNANTGSLMDLYDRALSGAQAAYQPKTLRYQTEAAAAQRQAENDWNRAWMDYLDKENVFYTNQGNTFSRLADMRDFALRSATAQ